MTGKPGMFGPAIIGQAQYDAEQKIVEQGAHVFGHLVTGVGGPDASPAGGPIIPIAPAPESFGKKAFTLPPGIKAAAPASIADLEEVLTANPAAFDILLAAELERPEGPRKGALRLFREAEEELGPAGRPEVLAQIALLLEA